MRKIVRVVCIALGIVVSLAIMAQAKANAKSSVNMGAFTTEIMIMNMSGNQTQFAMWSPYEFYVAANMEGDEAARVGVEKNLAFLKPYITVAVQCSKDSPDGSTVYATEEEVRARAVLKTPDGKSIPPLTKVPATVSIAMDAMKQAIAAEGDASGANTHILVFANKMAGGKPLIDASKRGSLKLVLKASSNYGYCAFVWKTPFDAMKSVPPCTKCKEHVSAKWSFCPWCGQKLPKD